MTLAFSMARTEFLDALAIDVESDHRHAAAGKGHRDWQSDITKPDNCYFSSFGHFFFSGSGLWKRSAR